MKIMFRVELQQYGCKDTIGGIRRIGLFLFVRRLKRIAVGSEKWHLLQEKLSNLPDVGYFAYKRSLFYMRTMNCGNEFYAAKGVVFYYPQRITIGKHTRMNRNVFITAKDTVTIGDHVMIGPNVIINSGNHNYSSLETPICYQGHTKRPIVIEDNVWIGANAVILAGVTLHEGCIVGAGAVVTHDVAQNSIVGGCPAKLIKMRDEA